MEIPPLQPVSLEALKMLAQNDGLIEGRILQARVEAMLSNTLARLNIGGQSVDLATTKPLPIGATLTLKVEHEDGQMRLVSQGMERPPPNPTVAVSRPGHSLADPLRMALEKIQAMTVEAMLDETETEVPRLPASRGADASDDEQALRNAGRQMAGEQHPKNPAAATLSALKDAGSELHHRVGAVPDKADALPIHTASKLAGGQVRAERTLAFAVEVPLLFPGNQTPLRLEVTRDEEQGAENGEEERQPSWTVRFAAEAGPLGMVHAAISLIDGRVGVHLFAEQERTAARFKENAFRLTESLQASGVVLDGVNIAQGRPADRR
jgi:hypothetical protein